MREICKYGPPRKRDAMWLKLFWHTENGIGRENKKQTRERKRKRFIIVFSFDFWFWSNAIWCFVLPIDSINNKQRSRKIKAIADPIWTKFSHNSACSLARYVFDVKPKRKKTSVNGDSSVSLSCFQSTALSTTTTPRSLSFFYFLDYTLIDSTVSSSDDEWYY